MARLDPIVHHGGAQIRIDWSELEAIFAEIDEASRVPGPELMELAAEDLLDGVHEEFETEGHGRWEPLAESTLARRRGSSAQILVDTGVLRGGLNVGEAVTSGDTWAEIRSAVFYGSFHVTGTVNMPARNFFDINEVFIARAEKTILDGILERAGFPADTSEA